MKIRRNKILSWIIPPVSELDYAYFFSLLNFGALALLPSYAPMIKELSNVNKDESFYLQMAGLICASLFLWLLFFWWGYRNLRSNKPMSDPSDRGKFVVIPAYFMILIGLFALIQKEANGYDIQLLDYVTWIVMFRSALIIFILEFRLYPIFSSQYDNYQANYKEVLFAVLLGGIGAIISLYFENYFAAILGAYILGQTLLQLYVYTKRFSFFKQ